MDTNGTKNNGYRRHESPELGAGIARQLRALVVRAAEGDTEALEQLAALEQLVPVATQLAGHLAHRQNGYSLGFIGQVLGISRQAAVKRYSAVPLWQNGPHYSMPMDWLTKRTSSGAVMRGLVGQLIARRSA